MVVVFGVVSCVCTIEYLPLSLLFLSFLSLFSRVLCLNTFTNPLCVFDYVTHAHRSPTPEKKKEEETTPSRAWRAAPCAARGRKEEALSIHTHREREREDTTLSFSLSLSLSLFRSSTFGSSQISLRFWRLENFVFLFVVKVVYVVVVSFRLFDDVEKSCFFCASSARRSPMEEGR